MSDYYVDYDGNITTKKKKKQNQNQKQTKSTTDYFVDNNGKITKQSQPEKVGSDIAPVKETKKEKKATWFNKGAFEDGYQFGDVSRTVASTVEDGVGNLYAGVLGMGEKVVDAGAYGVQAYGNYQIGLNAAALKLANKLKGNDSEEIEENIKGLEDAKTSWNKKMSGFIAKDLYDEKEVAKYLIGSSVGEELAKKVHKKIGIVDEETIDAWDITQDKYSLLGDKTDSVVQSAGQLGATIGLQAVGVPWWVTSGVTSFGGAVDEAYKEDATFEEAGLSAAITAGAELLTEKIGGVKFGGKTVTDVISKDFLRKISSKAVRTITKVGIDAAGEGFEEVLSGVMSAIGQKLTYADEKEFKELFSLEEAFDSFVGGVVLGGAFGGATAVRSAAKGIDPTTEMTKSDETVVNKIYNDEIAEVEKDGKKLNSKEKSKIYDNIVERLDKGDISTDTIEEVLGGSTFEEYKSITDKEKSLTDEISQLEGMPNEQITVKQKERLLEARKELENITGKTELKTKLSNEVYGLVKNSRLVESYNEVARKSQAFEADLTKYEGKQRIAVERAVKSGILNNTNKSHALVDTLSKIEADKGIIFDYTDNAKLKESGFAIEGKTVNGFVKNGGVTLNVQSAKAWQSTVGHEIAHVLEGTEHYGALQQALFKVAESKGELASRKAQLTELYKGIDADIDAELTADLVGDYLFSDSNFIKNLTTDRNLFQKVYDEIKYLCKVATGKQLTDIEKVKREFDKVWNELSVNTNAETDGKVNYSVSIYDNAVKQKQLEIIQGTNPAYSDSFTWIRKVEDIHTLEETLSLSDWQDYDEFNPDLTRADIENAIESGKITVYSSHPIENGAFVTPSRMEAETYAGNGKVYQKTVEVKDVAWIDPTQGQYAELSVDAKQPLSVNSKGNELSLAVQKRFANSKAVDENGNLKVLYHGTASGEFYTFDKSKGSVEGDFGSGFYFTDNETDVTKNYEGGGPDFENKIDRRAEQIEAEEEIDYIKARKKAIKELYKGSNKFKVYLNIENPAIVGETNLLDYDSFAEEYDRADYDSDEDYESDIEQLIAENIDQIIWDIERNIDIYSTDGIAEVLWNAINEGGIDIEQLKANINNLYLEDNNGNLVGNEITRQIIESLGYDGIIDNTVSSKFNMDIEEGTTHYIVFKPNQIKSIDNQNPTDNPDIRYSVSEEGLENIGKILYNNNSPLAIVNRAKTNNNSSLKWVYKAEIFSVTENKLFHEKISEINQGSQAFQKNSIDEYMLPIENKIVFTDGNYETPYISEIIEVLTDSQTEFEAIKERIFDVEKGKSSKQDAVRYVQNVYGKGCVITYTSGNDGVYGWEDGRRKGKTRRTVVRNYLNKYYGRGNVNQINGTKADLNGSAFLNADTQASLSKQSKDVAPVGTPLQELYLAPTQEDVSQMETVEEAPMPTDADIPPEMETDYYSEPDIATIDDKTLKNIGKSLRETLYLDAKETKAIQEIVQEYSTSATPNNDNLFDAIKDKFGEKMWRVKNEEIADVKRFLRTSKVNVSQKIKSDIADYSDFRKSIGGKLGISKDGLPVDTAYQQLVEMYPAFFSDEIWNETDQFLKMVEVANTDLYSYESYPLDDATIQKAVDIISNEVRGYKENLTRTAAEETAREALDSIAPPKAEQLTSGARGEALLNQSLDNFPIKTVEDRVKEKIRAVEAELADNQQLRREAESNYNSQIANLTEEYLGLKNNRTKRADNIVRRITKLERLKASADADYAKRISDLEARAEKMKDPKYSRALYKQAKMQEHADWAAELLGDTSTWVDKKLGLQYATNTERRNLRDIVRDENGNKDIARADVIDDELNGRYNREEAAKKRELAQVRGKYADLKITKAEDTYIQMLGELRGNPDTELTEKVVKEYYEKHKNKIDAEKVEKAIELARQDYDNLLNRVNEKLREQGMKEIPYRQGYFPHFTEPKQNFIQKLLNWKTQDNEIPTSIAGLTEDFKPVKSWQSFDKTRYSDETDYSFLKGFDTYSEGALDWIYHLDTLQKRRAVENHIRNTHSDEGIKARIKEVYANEEIDATEAQAQIEHILSEAKNPLNNFVQDFTTHTNILAGKKNSLDRAVEQATNRNIYSVMTNVQNRMSANMVLANVRSALTNFIPITQSWAQVSPMRSLQATKDTIANAIKEDGIINKSTFLTNRLKNPDNLYRTNWDKIMDGAGIMFEVVDNISSQVIWRSKYNQNLANGMSESEAIKNADQFAENVMAGRSKGNEPTLFNAKNPFVKAFTMFQLEVNNQYGYLFKDVPNDLKAETNHWKLNLVKGYTTAFIGAYVYNALMEQVAGSGAALDPIGIIEDVLRDLGLFDDDEEKEPAEAFRNFRENIIEEIPFIGSLAGGGRIPITSAIPYNSKGLQGGLEAFEEDAGKTINAVYDSIKERDLRAGDWSGLKNIGKELMNPLLNIGLPVGGGQIKKTVEGLKMFNTDDEHPVAGSYTDSGALRFPVDDTLGNRIQAGIFGQWANENAREYLENGYAPLKEKQIQEYVDVELPIADYWQYRDGLKGLKKNAEKADYINSLDIKDWQKNLLMNNILDRKEDVDMSNYDAFGSWEEFDFAEKNPEKYEFFKANGISYEDYANADEDGKNAYTWAYNNPEKYTFSKAITSDVVEYKKYTGELYDIKADKDANGKSISGSRKEKVINYINGLDADYYSKIILFKSEYSSDDTYNAEIINYINSRDDLTYDERVTIYTELGFTVKDGYVYWD